MVRIVDLGSVWPSWKHRPWWTFKGCPTTPRGVHAEAGPLGKVSPAERAEQAAPVSLPLWFVAMSQPPEVNP